MKPTRHIIADLETLDTQPSAVILTAGLIAVEITDTGLTVLSRWYRRLQWDTGHRQPGRTVSQDTVDWWLEQSDEAFEEAFADDGRRLPLSLAMHSLSAWLQLHPYPIWGNGSDFDNAILQHAFGQLGLRWPYWRNRCLRTLRGVVTELNPELKLPEWPAHLTKHVAIDDAEYEAHVLAVLLREIAPPQITHVTINATRPDLLKQMGTTRAELTRLLRRNPIICVAQSDHSTQLARHLAAFEETEKLSAALRLATLVPNCDPHLLNP